MAERRVEARVTGRVQGVFFRASTRERAQSLGLVGWVRNADDGAVELAAQGEAAAVESLIAWCATGPAAAQVTGVDVRDVPLEDDREFRVRR